MLAFLTETVCLISQTQAGFLLQVLASEVMKTGGDFSLHVMRQVVPPPSCFQSCFLAATEVSAQIPTPPSVLTTSQESLASVRIPVQMVFLRVQTAPRCLAASGGPQPALVFWGLPWRGGFWFFS